jgi:hypothetical protein
MINYRSLSQASTVESLLKTPVMQPESIGLLPDAIEMLADLGCPFAIALESGWTVMSSTTITNEYGSGIGRGKRRYSSDVRIDVPTENDHQYTFAFKAQFVVDFAARNATLITSKYRFCGEPYRFTERHEYEPTIHDYMYGIGGFSPRLERWINTDEPILPKVRRSWFKHFAPSRINPR